MTTTNKAYEVLNNLGPSLKSIGKIIFLTHGVSIKKEKAKGKIYILANGPSLRKAIDDNLPELVANTTMAVNFAANAPEFWEIRPKYYMLLDPYFFEKFDQDRVKMLWNNLFRVNWPLTLIVPYVKGWTMEKYINEENLKNITIRTINPVGVEGWHWLESLAYKKAWGMPRPRNVLIAAIMAAIQMGYDDIILFGADHSWMQSIWVDDNNCVVTVQPHFYKEDDADQARTNSEYAGIPLHEVIKSFYVAFEGYHRIARYANKHGISITNATPGSFIDAFPRKKD